MKFSTRQQEVIKLITQGYKNREIAEQLGLSVHTVIHHVAAIFQILGVHDRLSVALWWASQQGQQG